MKFLTRGGEVEGGGNQGGGGLPFISLELVGVGVDETRSGGSRRTYLHI